MMFAGAHANFKLGSAFFWPFSRSERCGYRILNLVKRPWGATDFRRSDPDGSNLRITSH